MVSAMSTPWIGSEWVGRVIDGRFTLERWLGGAAQSGVFLTHLAGEDAPKAAIKLVSGDATDAGVLLEQWTAATELSHPNILHMFYAGYDRVDGRDLLYAVTEYSEEILAEILKVRALTSGEVRELLDPVLGTLSWLHVQGLVHGGVKPSNIMVVNDQLKLSVDRIQPAGPAAAPFPSAGIYEAPGSADRISPAADVWSLGALLVEALTQRPPHLDPDGGDPAIPSTLPEPFAAIARECLRVDPARRCTLSQILTQIEPLSASGQETSKFAAVPPASANAHVRPARPVVKEPLSPPAAAGASSAEVAPANGAAVPSARTARQRSNDQSFTIFSIAALILLAGIAAMTFILPAPRSAPPSAKHHSAPDAAQPAAPAPAPGAATGSTARPTVQGAVLHRALPDASQNALNTIRGHVKVDVRVSVDANGKVSNAGFKSAGPSHYFAGLALDAARKWTFEPAQAGGRGVPSTWILQFDFARSGVDATAVETDS
jgi:outer membrane biosynthesis protein TonB